MQPLIKQKQPYYIRMVLPIEYCARFRRAVRRCRHEKVTASAAASAAAAAVTVVEPGKYRYERSETLKRSLLIPEGVPQEIGNQALVPQRAKFTLHSVLHYLL